MKRSEATGEGTTILVTGGAGFIGSNFVRYALAHTGARVVVLDNLTYAGSLETLRDRLDHPRLIFLRGDIADAQGTESVFREHRPAAVVNFAAETHVDRSIDGPRVFVRTNVVGTLELLEASRRLVKALPAAERDRFRFLQVSTDEVYGSLGSEGRFSETTPYAPNSPYAASKAAADHVVHAYHRTYALPTLITNCSNNYGPYQFPEKLIPLMILNALEGRSLPIYGDGGNVRDWLYVEDHCEALWLILQRGRCGEKYNVGANSESTNLQLVDRLCGLLEEMVPAASNRELARRGIESYASLKTFVSDRPGHDRRYAIDAGKLTSELGWKARHALEGGLRHTVRWYLDHLDWCEAVQRERYQRQRLGLGEEDGVALESRGEIDP
jgi:dTDP-glucose 4,6-dehydratase